MKTCLISSTNWPPTLDNPEPDRLLAPLKTVIGHINQLDAELSKVVMLGAGVSVDHDYCSLVKKVLFDGGHPEVDFRAIPNNDPSYLSRIISTTAFEAKLRGENLLIDLTSGPKSRAALMLGAASALPDAKIVCCESFGGEFRVTEIPSLEKYNEWLGPHGLLVRNYKREIENIRHISGGAKLFPTLERISEAVADFLETTARFDHNESPGPRTDLVTIAEQISNKIVPKQILGIDVRGKWQGNNYGKTCDHDIRANAKSDAVKAIARSSQTLYRLRCHLAHPNPLNRYQVLMFLDSMSFLINSICNCVDQSEQTTLEPEVPGLYVALDGDDVGRRFEELIADSTTINDALLLRTWSLNIQKQLKHYLFDLCEKWEGSYIAQTGDGFIAFVNANFLNEIVEQFRPYLLDATVSVGIGPTLKDAYLALKLCKARNRGGGFYLSMDERAEKLLWSISK